ncbi:hypothetical protein ASPBRDRAFT_652851 [Aspergillus brasiliensis CBS 101740]|uniref:Uncharacterized protein n=1 Tax=Aspergillus brasiliensis (strain CBS 101740 / IMI 381727 / IBT 21946) TaxID=767769 RepID=A0A1L9UF13_ASPBC|nr:hypothetical protein ASPBRDRAFT_652851 [Aspergillus brasiliensis CBS 101740]
MEGPASITTDIAKHHIDSISAQYKGILKNPTAQSIIDSALQFFGEDIYSTATHFLLELIQNADDNDYAANVTPTLALTYRNRVLRTDCNELGFKPGQVEAICNLGHSTKKDKIEATGEKGVGFKSVFSVAESVWIASGPYTFKFDASNQMGMLIPIWEGPPDGTRHANTSMYARFAPRADERIVFHDLNVLGAKVLTFLIKLRELRLHIELQSGNKICYDAARQDTTSPDGLSMTQLTLTGDMFPVAQRKNYIVCRYEVEGMPQEKKRQGKKNTELKLAFPVDESGQPVLESQDVYAVLPVRSYGFTFLLQGDFLLSTSREEISSSREWNRMLCESLPNAFTAAVKEIVTHRSDFPWFRFLPDIRPEKSFFEQVKHCIPSQVAKERVLLCEGVDENGQGILALPDSLRYVPREFRDSNGYPITLCPTTRDGYLSVRYLHEDWPFIERLGVKKMTPDEFMDDLSHLVNNHGVQDKTDQWHESLASTVIKLLANYENRRLQDVLRNLAILPLRDNEWVSGADRVVFLPLVPASVPGGLKICEINPAAVAGGMKSDRARFFEYAGARAYNPAIVCDLIVERQTAWTRSWQDSQTYQRRLTGSRVPELANQLYFLFKNKWTGDGKRSLWVLNERSQPCRASVAYIPSKEPDSAAVLLQGTSFKIEFLHRDYLGVGGGDRFDYMDWLRLNFGIWRIPRLATPANALSPDFQYLLDNVSSALWLLLLSKYFDQYSDWLVPGGWKSAKVLSSLRTTMVDCLHEEQSLLEETCRPGLEKLLPRKALLLHQDFTNWQLLSNLGVVVGMDLKFYFSRLAELKETEPSLEQIGQLYTDIEAKSQNSREIIRSTFINDALICVPNPRSKTGFCWLQPDDCIWKGPKSLKHTPKLQELYPDNEMLFTKILKLRNAGADLLLREIEEFKPEKPADILAILQDANSLLKKTHPYSLVLIKPMKIFPVRLPSQRDDFTLMTASDSWYIPDERQRRYFGQDLPLLVFNWDAFDDMPKIRSVFDLGPRKLVATREVFCEDKNPRLLEPTTNKFLTRIKLMSRLIAKDTPNIRKKVERLFTAELFSVKEIFWALTVRHNDQVITRGKGIAECLLRDNEEEPLKIWVSQNCIKYEMFPSELADNLCQLYKISERSLAQDTLTQPPGYVAEKLTNSGYTVDMEHEIPRTCRDGWGKRKDLAQRNIQSTSGTEESSRNHVRHPIELPPPQTGTPLSTPGRPLALTTRDRPPYAAQNEKNMPLSGPHLTTEADNREGLAGLEAEPSSGNGTTSATEDLQETAKETPGLEGEDFSIRGHDDEEFEKAIAGETIDGLDILREHNSSVPPQLNGSKDSGYQEQPKPTTHTSELKEEQAPKPVPDRTLLVFLKEELPPNRGPIKLQGGISAAESALVCYQVIDTAEKTFDLTILKPERRDSGALTGSALVEKVPLRIRQKDHPHNAEGVQLSLGHGDGNTPSQGRMKQHQQIGLGFQTQQKRGDRPHQPLERRTNGRVPSPTVSRDRKRPTVVYIPGLPQDLLRDYLHNRVRRKDPIAPARIVFLTGDLESLDNHDGLCIDHRIKTNPGRVHIDEETGVKTVFMTVPDPLRQEEEFSGELVISRMLQEALGNAYIPEKHWTSSCRSRVGYDSYERQEGPDVAHTAFVLLDSDPFTDFLVSHGCDQAKQWTGSSVSYYLDVQVTSGGLQTPFRIHHKDFEMARKTALEGAGCRRVYALIRLYDIYTQPKIAIFVNAWRLYTTGSLDLGVTGDHYAATLTDVETDTPNLSLVSLQNSTGHYKFHALESLKHIRLLRLCGEENDLTLRGDIVHVSLDENPSFTALSYTWGSALKPFSMRTPEGDIPITASLYYALSHIQQSDGSINIWADGISINQSDPIEKSQQISLLPTIYRQATQVYGWVGDDANDSSIALKSLQDIHASPNMVSRLNKRTWAAIIEFFSRSWFLRAWIIQEVILARDLQVVCGSEKLQWDKLYSAVLACENYAESAVKNLKIPATRNLQPILSLGETRKMYQENQKRELLDLFELFQHSKSTLRRDKLFTLLNIAADAEGFGTDYQKPLETIVRHYASIFVARGQALELLSRARGLAPSQGLPSWIPDWTTNRYPKTICSWPSERGFHAGGGGTASSGVDPKNEAILEIAGSIVDTIVKVGSFPSRIDKAMEYISEVLEFIDSSKADYPMDDEKEGLEFKIPIGDAAHGPWGDRQGLERSFQLLGQTLNRTKTPQSSVLVNLDTLREDLWLYCLTAVEFSERFGSAVVCQTARGYLGLVPAGAEPGDAIALISGGKVPFCLRREHEDYQVVGEAYIHGIMHGEAFKPEDVKTLRLC